MTTGSGLSLPDSGQQRRQRAAQRAGCLKLGVGKGLFSQYGFGRLGIGMRNIRRRGGAQPPARTDALGLAHGAAIPFLGFVVQGSRASVLFAGRP